MKKKIFIALALLALTFASSENLKAQAKRQKLFCVTVSCCSIGIFTIDIWHETTCHYVSTQKTVQGKEYNTSMKLDTKEELNEIEIPEDVVLAGVQNEKRETLVLWKGKYDVVDNVIYFTAGTIPEAYTCSLRFCNSKMYLYLVK